MKYQTINGWTVEKMKEQIRKKNNGKQAMGLRDEFFGELCVYETQDGNHCAVGCFIPEGHRSLSSGGNVESLLGCYKDLLDAMPLEVEALAKLQSLHDDADTEMFDIRDEIFDWIDHNVENGQ